MIGRSVWWLLAADFVFQLLLHAIPLLHLPGTGFAHGPRSVYVGLLCYEADNFSYAAWAAQVPHGHLLLSDLFTTEPHATALFNPYFLLAGALAGLFGTSALAVMVVLGIAASPLLGALVGLIAAELGFAPRARLLAVILVLFCSGPSALLHFAGLQGIDASFFDLFPATMVSFPFQASATAAAAGVLLMMCRTWRSTARHRIAWVAATALATAGLILVRPYQLPCLGLLMPLSLAVHAAATRRPAAACLREFAIAAAFLLPVGLYIAALSNLPVWHQVALGYQRIQVDRLQIATGFSLFWLAAGLGAARAWAGRRWDLLPLCTWFIATVLASLALGPAATKFDDSAVIAYALLGAFGVEHLLAGPRRATALPVIAVAVATTLTDWAAMVHSLTPGPDRDILAIATLLRRAPGTPLVLAECDVANALPAFAGVRIYAGHWSMTLDNDAKCTRLARAGFGPGPDSADAFDTLLSETHPNYLLLRAGSAADGYAARVTTVWSSPAWRLGQL